MTDAVYINGSAISGVKRIEVWQQTLPLGIGTFEIEFDDSSGALREAIAPQSTVLIVLQSANFFAGYCDRPKSRITESNEGHFERTYIINGRCKGQNLMTLSYDSLLNDRVDLLIAYLLYGAGSSVVYPYFDTFSGALDLTIWNPIYTGSWSTSSGNLIQATVDGNIYHLQYKTRLAREVVFADVTVEGPVGIVAMQPSTTPYVGFLFRYVDDSHFYQAQVIQAADGAGNPTGNARLRLRAGYSTILADVDLSTVLVLGGTHTLRAEAQGTSIKVYFDGVKMIDLTDSTFTAAGYACCTTNCCSGKFESVLIAHGPVIYGDTKGRSLLFDVFKEWMELANYEGFVNVDGFLEYYEAGTIDSTIPIQTINNSHPANNIKEIVEYDEGDATDLKNIIIAFGPKIDDHFSELNASDWTKLDAANLIEDFIPNPPQKGFGAIKVTKNGGTYVGAGLVFPKLFHYYLDFSKVAKDKVSLQFYTSWSDVATRNVVTLRLGLVDDLGNHIHQDVAVIDTGFMAAGIKKNNWYGVEFPIGSGEIDKWTLDVGTDIDDFTWKVVEFHLSAGYSTVSSNIYFIFDGLKMPEYVYAVADHSPGATCAICGVTFPATPDYGDRHCIVTKNDVSAQVELEEYAECLADKRMNPIKRLHLWVDGAWGLIGGVWMWKPGYKCQVYIPALGQNYADWRFMNIHHIITDSDGDQFNSHKVELNMIPALAVVDSNSWNYGTSGTAGRVRRIHDQIRYMETRKGYTP